MVHAWRIDTLDPIGGLAFISWREESLFNEEECLEDVPVYFIGAPNFVPEVVVNRSVALAAERYGFQLGLLDANGELELDSLDNAAEFFRRLYLSGSRGDSAPDSSLPSPPPDEPPSTGGIETAIPEQGSLAEDAKRFLEISTALGRGQQVAFSWEGFSREISVYGQEPSYSQLEYGALLLAEEVLKRFPGHLDFEELEKWRRSKNALLNVLFRLELSSALKYFYRNDRDGDQHIIERYYYMWNLQHSYNSICAPIDILSNIPVPSAIAIALEIPNPTYASLAQVLSVGLGNPYSFIVHQGVEALTLLAAAQIAVVDSISHFTLRDPFFEGEIYQSSRNYRWEQTLIAAQNWLTQNLPSTVFESTIESIIWENVNLIELPPEPDASELGLTT